MSLWGFGKTPTKTPTKPAASSARAPATPMTVSTPAAAPKRDAVRCLTRQPRTSDPSSNV